jgi:uncharacterized protein (DUF697 family)
MPRSQDPASRFQDVFGIGDDADDLPPAIGSEDRITSGTRAATVDNTIKNHVLVALSLGLVPLPVFDVVVLTTNQVKMIHSLGRLYDVQPFRGDGVKAVVLSSISGTLPVAGVLGLSSGLKILPGVGSLIGSGSVAVTGSALTYALGRVFAKHFESGGTYLTLDKRRARVDLGAEIGRGRDFVSGLGGGGDRNQTKAA